MSTQQGSTTNADLSTAPRSEGFSWLRVKAIFLRLMWAALRTPHRLFDLTVWPLVDVLLFGSLGVFVAGGAAGDQAFGYLLSGIVLWHVVYQSQISGSTAFLEETWTRNLLNLLVTPLRESEYAVGVALMSLTKLVLGVGVVALTALLFFAFDITDLGVGLIPVVAVLLMVGWVISIFVVGLVLRFGNGAEALAWGIMFAIMPLSGVFYPASALPGFLQPVALALPTTHAFSAARDLFDKKGINWGEIGVSAVTAVILAGIAVWFLAKMLQIFRSRGYITRYS
ncbi:MAG: type transport system permease protein [Actinomycetota bacterium]|nr:type transport system permease protein [Actinomycetota bacterium]